MNTNKEVIPYKDQSDSKKKQVASMFNNIAHKYDFLNHFLSLGIDKIWRKKAIENIKDIENGIFLDVATGTADLAIESLRADPEKIIGIDISSEMLNFGKRKIKKKGITNIELMLGDSENLDFPNSTFDAVTSAFGVRNFENLSKGLSEMNRVLKSSGKIVILEFSKPTVFPIKQLYNLYFKNILPLWGKFFSKDNSAYTYLPESVSKFPDGNDFLQELNNCGFINTKRLSLSFGIVSIYTGEKK